jgi:hypothetical protein
MLTLIHVFDVAVSRGLVIHIWLFQIIIDPGPARRPSGDVVNCRAWTVTRITMVVLPLMICEIIVAIAWCFLQDNLFYPTVAGGLVILVGCSTFTFQVPIHKGRQKSTDKSKTRRLVATDWISNAISIVKIDEGADEI